MKHETIESTGEIIDTELTDTEIAEIHDNLKYLASCCDGAHAADGTVFNRFDTKIGKSLASSSRLTQKQAELGKALVHKYRRQLKETP